LFYNLLANGDTTDMRRTLFIQEKGYNAVLSTVNEAGEFDNVLSVKFKKESDVEKLVDDHGFYLV